MEAVKVSSVLCLLLLLMPLFFAPSCGKEACEEWTSDTYRMLILCSNKKCNRYCIDEGATRGKCGFLFVRSFCYCVRECD